MKNPLLDRLDKKSKQSRGYWQSPKKEAALAKSVGGRTTLASGSKKEKGDVRKVGVTRLEHKITQNKSFSVTREMIRKVENAALACEEVPALVVEFINPKTGKSEGEIACIPMADLKRLLNQ